MDLPYMTHKSSSEIFPNEILDKIFGHLTFTEKLISRLVCSKWNEQLVKSTTYHISSKRSLQVILDSVSPWRNLHVSNIGYTLPIHLRTLISSLSIDLDLSSFFYSDCVEFIARFCNLKDLSINIEIPDPNLAKDYPNSDSDSEDGEEHSYLKGEFDELARSLMSVSLRFSCNEYNGLDDIVNVLASAGDKLKFRKIILKENPPLTAEPTSTEPYTDFPFRYLLALISRSASTLETLNLEVTSDHTKNALAEELMKELNSLDEGTPTKLKELFLGFGLNRREDFLIFQEFIAKQKNLITLGLPWITTAAVEDGLHQKLMEEIVPRTMKKFSGLRKEHVTTEFSRQFGKLNSISMRGFDEMGRSDESVGGGPWHSVHHLVFDFSDLEMEDYFYFFYNNMSSTFVNLTELILQSESSSHRTSNFDLRGIITSFTKLRVLKIANGEDITDYSISGRDSLEDQIRTRMLYLVTERMDAEKLRLINDYEGPISSLKYLREFVLLKSEVTDAGIYFGLNFGPTSALKNLTFQSTSKNVTDWGLNWLGENNPQLEAFHGIFNMKRISSEGKQNFKYKLPMIQYTKKFKFQDQDTVGN